MYYTSSFSLKSILSEEVIVSYLRYSEVLLVHRPGVYQWTKIPFIWTKTAYVHSVVEEPCTQLTHFLMCTISVR